jgi:hypothetical protein
MSLPESYDPNYPYMPIFDGSEALPDPAWDYYEVWVHAIALRQEADRLMATFIHPESDAQTPKTDQVLRDHMRQIAAQTNEILRILG